MSDASQTAIAAVCDRIKEMLLAKNRAYGDSALAPLRVFSRASSVEQILVRLDDKLSRLARGSAAGEDVVLDLVGYLVLLIVAREKEAEDEPGLRIEHPDTLTPETGGAGAVLVEAPGDMCGGSRVTIGGRTCIGCRACC